MTDKTCPFHQGLRFDTRLGGINVFADEKKCDGKDCQLWVDVIQNRVVQAGEIKFADPENEYRYEGCGLVQIVPWQLVRKEQAVK